MVSLAMKPGPWSRYRPLIRQRGAPGEQRREMVQRPGWAWPVQDGGLTGQRLSPVASFC